MAYFVKLMIYWTMCRKQSNPIHHLDPSVGPIPARSGCQKRNNDDLEGQRPKTPGVRIGFNMTGPISIHLKRKRRGLRADPNWLQC